MSAGLLPALGIKHRGRSNPFCLADDLMEPLRPLVDRRVRYLCERGELGLERTTKADLLGVLTEDVGCGGLKGPLLVTVTRYVASFVEALEAGDPARLVTPRMLGGGGGGGEANAEGDRADRGGRDGEAVGDEEELDADGAGP